MQQVGRSGTRIAYYDAVPVVARVAPHVLVEWRGRVLCHQADGPIHVAGIQRSGLWRLAGRAVRCRMPISAASPPSKPHAILAEEHYLHILSVIENMRAMEYSPKVFASIDEEAIRFTILIQLNARYEGSASGETFNYQGKTDILIREQNIAVGIIPLGRGSNGRGTLEKRK